MSLDKGHFYESEAIKFLTAKGYKILDKNFRTQSGEIDVIVRKNNLICFVEVKMRKNNHFGGPWAAITKTKLKRIIKTAKYYIGEHNLDDFDFRFDAVLIDNEKFILIENIYTEGLNNN